jgi:hypothetical protein
VFVVDLQIICFRQFSDQDFIHGQNDLSASKRKGTRKLIAPGQLQLLDPPGV